VKGKSNACNEAGLPTYQDRRLPVLQSTKDLPSQGFREGLAQKQHPRIAGLLVRGRSLPVCRRGRGAQGNGETEQRDEQLLREPLALTLKPCRGGCGTDLLDPGVKSLYDVCFPCLATSPPVDPQKAWRAVKEQRASKGLDTVNLSELADEEAGYRNVVVGGAETLIEQERYV
jgi:hypothetical protein